MSRRRRRPDRDFHAEVESHLRLEADRLREEGLEDGEALAAARRAFGNVTAVEERFYEAGRWLWADHLVHDLRHAARVLRRSPAFTSAAALSLALGIGANTAVFSLLNAVMLRPLSIEEPDRLVALNNTSPQAPHRMFPTFSLPNYEDFRDRNDVFSGLIAYRFAPLSLSHDGINARLWGYLVTGNYFRVLGVRAARGRVISEDDDRMPGGHPVTVLSHGCWLRRFGGDPDVVGKDVIVNGGRYQVIGVAAQGFDGTEIIAAPEMWFPMAMQAQIEVGRSWLRDRETELVFVQGRFEPGVGFAQAQAALDLIASQLEREHPEVNEGKRAALSVPGLLGRGMRRPVLGFAGMLMVAVGLLLLLACTNLANLLLARAADRCGEIALRLALGASRFRLARQLLAESLLLAAGGGAAGLLLGSWLVGMAGRLVPPLDVPVVIDLHVDHRVLGFTCAVSILSGLMFGLLPALQGTKADLVSILKTDGGPSGPGGSGLKGGLIVLQVALSLVLLISGGLMLRALQGAQSIDLGFDPSRVVEASFDLRLQGYDAGRGRAFQKELLDRVRGAPGVESAAIADLVPVDLHFSRAAVFLEGQPPPRAAQAPRTLTSRVSPGYFRTMGTRLVRGRDFGERDDQGVTPVAIVNETFARRFWPGADPLGKRISLGDPDAAKLQVVGVAQDGKYSSLNEGPTPFAYRPLLQSYVGTNSVLVRSAANPQAAIVVLRDEVRRLDPHLPISRARTLAERLALALLPVRAAAALLGAFGLFALALAAMGLYGVMSYVTSRRTREIGVRMALGADRADILKLVMGQGVRLTVAGVGIGFAAALGLTRLMRSFLLGVSAIDQPAYAGAMVVLAGVALVACYLPASRAMRVDPLLALRDE